MASKFPDEEGITRHAVARICARLAERRTPVERDDLAVSTVKKVYDLLKGAWGLGAKNGLLVNRTAIKDATMPALPKSQRRSRRTRKQAEKMWTPDEFGRFLEWSIERDRRLWPLWAFIVNSADRRGDNLGLHWEDIDWQEAVAHLFFFVEVMGLTRFAGQVDYAA